MTCLKSTQSPAQMKRFTFLSIMQKKFLKSDEKCGCPSLFCDKIVQSKMAAMEKSVFAL